MSYVALPPRYGLSLCAGGGGLDMGLGLAEPGFATACYVEIDDYPRQTLIEGQRAGYLHPAPIWGDLKRFSGRPWRGIVDTLLAGYPCQPFSQAGQRRGEDDERHLWPDIERIIGELGPGLRWCFFENVAGHLTLGLETVVRSLRSMGFRVAVGPFSAAETGATHERLRVFIVAYRSGSGCGWRAKSDRHQVESKQQSLGRRDTLRRNDLVGTAVDHTAGTRRFAAGERTDPEREGGQCLPGEGRNGLAGPMVNTPIVGRGEGRAEHGLRGGGHTAASAGGAVADAKRDAGHQGRCGPRSDSQTRGGTADRPCTPRPSISPPGPDDMAAWRNVLAVYPDGAPSLSLGDLATFSRYFASLVEAGHMDETQAESRLCLLADGLAGRARILRLLGNGVCPLAAAYAWRTLSAAHGLGRVDMGTAA